MEQLPCVGVTTKIMEQLDTQQIKQASVKNMKYEIMKLIDKKQQLASSKVMTVENLGNNQQ